MEACVLEAVSFADWMMGDWLLYLVIERIA